MPPKKSATTKSHPAGATDPGAKSKPTKQEAETKAPEPKDAPVKISTSKTAEKAKNPPSKVPSKRKAQTSDEPSKAPRRSARGAQQPSAGPLKMLQFLLSPASLDLCRPKDEIEDLKTRGPDTRTYSSSDFSPFEELLCAVILSRPISHALGLRSIRTILNEPWNMSTPKRILDMGKEECRLALDEAKTQHRQKTADELVMMAEAVAETLGDDAEDVSLEKVRRESNHDVDKVRVALLMKFNSTLPLIPKQERQMLKKNIKGLGDTGLDIFFRRIQGVWPASYPFADKRTLSALKELGLPNDQHGLKQLLDEHWDQLDAKGIEAKDEEEKKRKVFVRVLERAVGADLEKHSSSVISAAGNA